MKVTLLQSAPVWGDPQASRAALGPVLAGVGETDLIVLPEMFSTGFVTEPEGMAENGLQRDCDTLEWMRQVAAGRGAAVAGSLAVQTETGFRNRFYFVRPDGGVSYYDKRHLFSYAGEQRRYTPGESRVIVPWKGFRILLQVCYDLRFPVFSRNRIAKETGSPEYDLALYVASWPESRIDAWDCLLRSRAIENQCFVAGVNRVGQDPGNRYCGNSVLLGPGGNLISNCKKNSVDFSTVTICMSDLDAFRKSFPTLFDAD